MDTQQFNVSNRLAEISKRQMARAMQLPTRATAEEERKAMQAETHNGSNGVGKKATRTRQSYTAEYKAETLAKFEGADDKKVFAAEAGVPIATLYRWKLESGETVPKPPKPEKTRTARPRADGHLGEPSIDEELDALRRLLALPADARDRIVAYLTSRYRR